MASKPDTASPIAAGDRFRIAVSPTDPALDLLFRNGDVLEVASIDTATGQASVRLLDRRTQQAIGVRKFDLAALSACVRADCRVPSLSMALRPSPRSDLPPPGTKRQKSRSA